MLKQAYIYFFSAEFGGIAPDGKPLANPPR